ncbi:hypothetical protein HHH56_07225 [Flammeovirga yaeyamensis]|nr:hypothetical protein [Flammeovirga yaeyamensis]
MITCKKASELIDKEAEVGISFKEKLQLSFHTFICKACKQYRVMSDQLGNTLQKFIGKSHEDATLSEAKKEEILKNLKKNDDEV